MLPFSLPSIDFDNVIIKPCSKGDLSNQPSRRCARGRREGKIDANPQEDFPARFTVYCLVKHWPLRHVLELLARTEISQ